MLRGSSHLNEEPLAARQHSLSRPLGPEQTQYGEPLVSHSTTTIRRHSQHDDSSYRSFIWMSMLMSLAVVFFGLQLMMVGPLKGRLDGIQSRLEQSENSMRKLVANRGAVAATNDLLSGLQEQSTRLDSLRHSINSIQTLRTTLQQESESSSVAMAALDRMSGVQQRLLQQQGLTQRASASLQELEELQQAIITGTASTDVAATSLDGLVALQNRLIAASNGYEAASEGVARLNDLTQRIAGQSEDIQIAAQRFDEFISLKDAVQTAAADLTEAHSGIAGLNSLKQDVVAAADQLPVAQETARTLVAMNENLAAGSAPLATARQNLDALLALQHDLSHQSEQVATMIQNLEIMEDFRTEVAAHVESLDSLRRTMMEIAMMETTLGRVAQVVEPLAELGNLRRLNENEIREAARVILDRRAARYSQSEPAAGSQTVVNDSLPAAGDSPASETLVPLPPEARQ